jgi:hypothetical protein
MFSNTKQCDHCALSTEDGGIDGGRLGRLGLSLQALAFECVGRCFTLQPLVGRVVFWGWEWHGLARWKVELRRLSRAEGEQGLKGGKG